MLCNLVCKQILKLSRQKLNCITVAVVGENATESRVLTYKIFQALLEFPFYTAAPNAHNRFLQVTTYFRPLNF